ncbi:MAG: nitroreductase family protein [archaeon]|jgi:nitroreductase
MDFLDLAKKRYSVRKYSSKAVEEEKLSKILEAAQIAPTAKNAQPFKLIVIKTKGREKELLQIYSRDWFVTAPIVICACTTKKDSWARMDGKNYCDIDLAIALDHLILQATELGLGTCWVGAFDPNKAKELLSLPKEYEPILFVPIGYSIDEPREKIRKPLNQLVSFE